MFRKSQWYLNYEPFTCVYNPRRLGGESWGGRKNDYGVGGVAVSKGGRGGSSFPSAPLPLCHRFYPPAPRSFPGAGSPRMRMRCFPAAHSLPFLFYFQYLCLVSIWAIPLLDISIFGGRSRKNRPTLRLLCGNSANSSSIPHTENHNSELHL